MKSFLLIVLLGVAGYYGYKQWFTKPEPPPAPTVAKPVPKPTPIDFSIKVSVGKLYNYWRLTKSGRGGNMLPPINPSAEFNHIRRILSDKYREHTDIALQRNVRQAVAELRETRDLPSSEQEFISKGIQSLSSGGGTR